MCKILWCLLLIPVIYGVNLPSYIPRCKYFENKDNLTSFNKCITDHANQVTEIVKNGFPELGIPRIDTFVIPEVFLQQNGRIATFNVTLNNVTAQNLWKYQVTKAGLKIVGEDYLWHLDMFFADLKINGGYHISGSILNQIIKRGGHFQANISNSNMMAKMRSHIIKKQGEDYVSIYKSNIKVTLGKIDADLGNLFGIETLDKAAASFLATSANDILENLSPDIEGVIQKLTFSVLNRFAEAIPLRSIFP